METILIIAAFIIGIIIGGFLIKTLQKANYVLRSKHDELLQQNNDLVTTIKVQSEKLESQTNTTIVVTNKTRKLEEDLTQAKEKIAVLETQKQHYESKQTELYQKQNQDIQLQKSLQSEIEKKNIQIAEANPKLAALTDQNLELTEIITQLKKQVQEYLQQITSLTSKLSTETLNNNNNKEKAEQYYQEVTNLKQEVRISSSTIQTQKTELAKLEQQNTIINDLVKEQKDELLNLKTHNEQLIQKQRELIDETSTLRAKYHAIVEKYESQKKEIEDLQTTAHLQFEKIANKLLEEKSQKFTEVNKINIDTLLSPLKSDLISFKTKVEDTYEKESKQIVSLEQKIKDLIEHTNKISSEANNLAAALKGKPQARGNWGEMILERILESSGLRKGTEYFLQQSSKNNEGDTIRPDVKVVLPDQRVIIIDSKVSLIAYDKYVSAQEQDLQYSSIVEHVKATKDHIDQLSKKSYDDMNVSLDFTMMFIPIEPAYLLAVQASDDLWNYAYTKRILLVSPTTLIACLKLFSDLWRREWQNENAMQIVKKGESLYNKFVTFSESFLDIGKHLKQSQAAYSVATKQLSTGKGNIISQAKSLKELRLKSTKEIPESLQNQDDEDDENESHP